MRAFELFLYVVSHLMLIHITDRFKFFRAFDPVVVDVITYVFAFPIVEFHVILQHTLALEFSLTPGIGACEILCTYPLFLFDTAC